MFVISTMCAEGKHHLHDILTTPLTTHVYISYSDPQDLGGLGKGQTANLCSSCALERCIDISSRYHGFLFEGNKT